MRILPTAVAASIALLLAARAEPPASTPPTNAPSNAPGTAPAATQTPPLDTNAIPPDRTFTVDAVLLQSGKVVDGSRQFAVAYEGNLYLFSSATTLEQFNRDPEHFAARDGGACGRMGPLGGLGDARRYAVQDGSLYFFDSEACREEFRKKPLQYIETYDEMPVGTPAEQAAGLAAIDRWVAWAGGKEAVKAAGSMKQTATQRVMRGQEEWDLTESIAFDGPHSMRRTSFWQKVGGKATDSFRTQVILDGQDGAVANDRGVLTPLSRTRRTAFERTMNRQPYAILRARYRPEAGFMAIKTGEGKLGDADCDFVVTWFEGNRTYLAIDKSTGRLVQEGYIGRDTLSRVNALTLDAKDYAGADALRLPTKWVVSLTGNKEGDEGPLATITLGPAPAPAPKPKPPQEQKPASPLPQQERK
jgi:YHS domain-containing protein